MKKLLGLITLVLCAVCFIGCSDKTTKEPTKAPTQAPTQAPTTVAKTFMHDGSYVAFAYDLNYGAPQLTWVTLVVENDKVKSITIDAIQSKLTIDEEGKGLAGWNEKTKKELGYEYYMFPASGKKVDGVLDVEAYKTWLADNGKLEWFEQAAIIEAELLKDINADFDTVIKAAGATISDSHYTELAKEAYANAVAGKLIAVEAISNYGVANVAWVEAKIDAEGKITDYVIDTIQASTKVEGDPAACKFAWNEKTKQELGYEYYMFPASGKKVDGVLDVEAYKTWLVDNGKLEWFEQVAIVCEKWEASHAAEADYAQASVTVSTGTYVSLLTKVDGYAK